MQSSDYYMNFSPSTKFPCFKSEYDGAHGCYYFNIFPSGIIIKMYTNASYALDKLFFIPYSNLIVYKQSPAASFSVSDVTLFSTAYKIYCILGRLDDNSQYSVTIHEGRGNSRDPEYVYSNTNLLALGESCTYTFPDETDAYPAFEIKGRHSNNQLYEFNRLIRIIFIEPGQGVGHTVTGQSGMNKSHYQLYKYTSDNPFKDEYGLIANISPQAGQTYTFLNWIGDCFLSQNGNTNTTKLNNSLPSNRDVSYGDYSQGYRNVHKDNDHSGVPNAPVEREPRLPNSYMRRLTGQLGVQGIDTSYIPYRNSIDEDYCFDDFTDTLIESTSVSPQNPGVLFDNLLNNQTIDKDTEIKGVDRFRLKVKDTIYLIPPNGTVALFTRKITGINDPSDLCVPYITKNNNYVVSGSNVGLLFTDVPGGHTDYGFARSGIYFTNADNDILKGTNNFTFQKNQYILNHSNTGLGMSNPPGTTGKCNTKRSTNFNIKSGAYGQPLTGAGTSSYAYAVCIIEKIQPTTEYPIINDYNKTTLTPSWGTSVTYEKYNHGGGPGNDQGISGALKDDDNNPGFAISGYCTTYRGTGYDTWAATRMTVNLYGKAKGSGLQPPSTEAVTKILLNPDAHYKNIPRTYHDIRVTETFSYSYKDSYEYGPFTAGVSLNLIYEKNSNYADTGQYLIAYPAN